MRTYEGDVMGGTTTEATPRVWLGCLACYNDGILTGKWFDAGEAPADRSAWDVEIDYGVVVSEYHDTHDELWVFDHEGFYGLLSGECSPSEAQRVAQRIEDIETAGYDVAAYAAYSANVGKDYATLEEFEESYQGEHDNRRSFARDLSDDMIGEIPDAWPYSSIDWESAARDLFLSGDYYDAPNPAGGVFVFRSI